MTGFVTRLRVVVVAAGLVASFTACDDSVPGPIGGLLLSIVTEPALAAPFDEVDKVEIVYHRVEAVVADDAADANSRKVVLDTQVRTLVLSNVEGEALVAQFQVPVGIVGQLRVFPTAVTLHLRDGSAVALDPETSDLPSWRNTGWKIEPTSTLKIVLDEVSGLRGHMRFFDRLVRNGSRGQAAKHWKLKPTLEGTVFDPNPPGDGAGVFVDQLNVAVQPGTPTTRVEAMSAAIGATVMRVPVLSTWYRIKLPATQNLETGVNHFNAQPEVVSVLPHINLGDRAHISPNEGSQANDTLANLPAAWNTAGHRDALGNVGSMAVRVAVIEGGGIDVTHADIRRNIAINQGELPLGLFDVAPTDGTITAAEITAFDCDPVPGDGLITIRDMECNAAIAPPDSNGNMVIDALDVLADPRWADGVDDDDFDANPATFIDDLVGWNFGAPGVGNNQPQPTDVNSTHGTRVASVVGAEGNNGLAMAGANWRVSIVPLRASTGTDFTPLQSFSDALSYIEARGYEVANFSGGWTFEREGISQKCGDRNAATAKIRTAEFNTGRQNAIAAFNLLFPSASRTLYTFATGNNAYDVDDPAVVDIPSSAMRVIPNVSPAVVTVGAALDATNKAPFSSYASAQTNVDIYAPGVNWTVLMANGLTCSDLSVPSTCNALTCRNSSGALLNECTQATCPLEGNTATCTTAGTSFASPAVAGAGALLLANTVRLRGDPATLRTSLMNTATTVGSFAVCGAEGFNGRLLDADAFLVANPP